MLVCEYIQAQRTEERKREREREREQQLCKAGTRGIWEEDCGREFVIWKEGEITIVRRGGLECCILTSLVSISTGAKLVGCTGGLRLVAEGKTRADITEPVSAAPDKLKVPVCRGVLVPLPGLLSAVSPRPP